jgi:hypothetical protein
MGGIRSCQGAKSLLLELQAVSDIRYHNCSYFGILKGG